MTELPSGWERRVLGEIAQTQLGKMLNSAKQTGVSEVPYLRNINVRWGSISLDDVKVMDVYEEERDKFTLKEGDLLVCEGGEPGRSAVWKLDAEMAFQNAIHRVRVAEGYSPDFIGLQFEWLAGGGALDQFFTGVTIKHFSQQKLRRVPLVAPSLSEQEAIVRTLDMQLARLDTVLASVQAVRERADQLRRSLLHAAFTGQLTRDDPDSEGEVRNEWPAYSLGEIERHGWVKLGRGKVISKRDIEAIPGDYPIYSSAGKNGGEFGRYGDFLFDEELITWSVDGGGHLFHRPRHRFSVTNVGGWIRILNFKVVGYRYLYYALRYAHSQTIFDWSHKAHPSVIRLEYDSIPIPTLVEQAEIVRILDAQLTRLYEALAVADRVEAECGRLRRSLLQAAFTGELTKTWREANG